MSPRALALSTGPIRRPLTRTTGYLRGVTSHSLQPYRGCPLGRSLCGVACYVQHSRWITRGEPWGSFLEARPDVAAAYLEQVERERRWARRARGALSVFLSSASEPFPPQERRLGVTRRLLEAMIDAPPDRLVVQTHTAGVLDVLDTLVALARRCAVRLHVSIETDRERLPGLPPPGVSVARRFEVARAARAAGLETVVTVSPLLPIAEPDRFFARIAAVADAVVVDHFVGGDGSIGGARTLRTALPAAMAAIDPASTMLAYRDRMVAIACRYLPGRVGVSADGFAGRWHDAGRPDTGS